MAHLDEVRRRAEAAREKPAVFGPDLDLADFHVAAQAREEAETDALRRQIREAALRAGVDLEDDRRAGTFLQVDHSVLTRQVQKLYGEQLEILPSAEALGRHPGMEQYWWRAVAPDADKYTAAAALDSGGGYFIRVLPGAEVAEPIQACLLIAENNFSQNVHNIVIVEEGAAAQIIAGCTIHRRAAAGLHIGVSEFYVKRGGSLTFTMIHQWAEGFHVRPRTGTWVEEGGTFVSNYLLLSPVRSLQMFPATRLRGPGARARFQAVLCGRGDSVVDAGSRTVLEGDRSASEAVSRTIGADRSATIVRGQLIAKTDRCRARLECRGMLVSTQASIIAVPELEADGVPRAELSHEAAISPIAEEEVAYLMARGFAREEAVAAITRGFLNVDLLGLPPALAQSVDAVLAATPAEAGL